MAPDCCSALRRSRRYSPTVSSSDRSAPPGVPTQPVDDSRFRLLVSQVTDYAIFLLDPKGHVMTWNAGAERLKGYRAEDIIGQHFSKFYRAQDRWK